MSEKNKDLKKIDDALNSGTLNENDFFEFDSATVEIIYGAAERMATMIKILQELNKTMQATYDNLEARIEFLHEANITLQAVDSQRLEELSEQTRKNEYWITELNIETARADCLEAEIERLKAELEKRSEVQSVCITCERFGCNLRAKPGKDNICHGHKLRRKSEEK